MNLKTASQWRTELAEVTHPLTISEMQIRQIQADALRWAAQLSIEKGEPDLFHAFTLQANQLDPNTQ